ncbi:hypothetical protein NQ176_g1921 [Zarea fungicola]|uniref:Uncharacterized protein n=1 Tax=Zarea fungicola TaxID=93591 RepID=A0ACC1NQL0_9HYPO|nr:hypothetical protein NQ176_g1921 [Lecanicillium fungicola]
MSKAMGWSFNFLLRRAWQYIIAGTVITLLITWYIFQNDLGPKSLVFTDRKTTTSSHQEPSIPKEPSISKGASIPNLANFVYILEDPTSEIVFHFADFLSIYSALYHWHPDAIYLHTNAADEMINRARRGGSGKWSRMIFTLPEIKIIPVVVPTHAGNGHPITLMEHKSDFIRVEAIRRYGGVYIDFDVYALRDMQVLRQSGFQAVAGRQHEGELNSGTFLSTSGSKMIEAWSEEMNIVYDGAWTTHSNHVLTQVSERLVPEAGEILIMERQAFAPGSWNADDCIRLFEVHEEASLNLTESLGEISLPSHQSTSDQSTVTSLHNSPTHFPWATDWSRTYLLHAFKPGRSGAQPNGFEEITPRYVLQQGSNFARAVYPVAEALYRRGYFSSEDIS